MKILQRLPISPEGFASELLNKHALRELTIDEIYIYESPLAPDALRIYKDLHQQVDTLIRFQIQESREQQRPGFILIKVQP